jgi:hypothetical protein
MSTPDQPQGTDPIAAPATEAVAATPEAQRSERPAAAALLAAGVGATALGLFTTLAEANDEVRDWLALTDEVGPLAGKTVYTVAVWLVAWAVIHWLVRPARVGAGVLIATGVLLALGVLGTFPVFFEAFAPE